MNYYIKGDAAKAEQIKAAFEKLGYSTSLHTFFDEDTVFITLNGNICECNYGGAINELIKTHPDYQELELPVEPKFKVGDWVVRGEGFVYEPSLITEIRDYYICESQNGERATYTSNDVHKNFHLWTIQDAKDGDVITNGKLIVIFNKLEEPAYKQHIIAYAGLDLCGRLQITEDTWQLGVDRAIPATKEQRDLLFAKMREAGYKWDAEKRELKKTKPHYDISNFKAGMPVLVRWYSTGRWRYSLYSFYEEDSINSFDTVKGSFTQCIPYNDDTKYLLGTTDMCPEEYINW